METHAEYTAPSGESVFVGLWTEQAILNKSQPLRYTFPGLYFLIRQGRVVYVGQSTSNILARIAQHTFDKEFDSFTVIPAPHDADLNEIEAAYIYQLEPHYNSSLPRNGRYYTKSKAMDLLNIDGYAFRDIVKRKRLRPHLGRYYDLQDFQEQEQ